MQPRLDITEQEHTKVKIICTLEGKRLQDWYREAILEKLEREQYKIDEAKRDF